MFRVKIVLLSVLLSGSVLVGLGIYSLSVMDTVGLARIDREILTLGEGHLAVRPPRDYWQNFATSLRFIYGEERSGSLIVWIRDQSQATLFQSAHWPHEINENSFPDFDRTMDARPPSSDPDFDRTVDTRPPPSDDRRADENHQRRPPPEAYKACEGKAEGSPSEFVNPQGETVSGICEEEDGTLVLRRTRPRGDRQNRPVDGPGGTGFSDHPGAYQAHWTMPRIKKKPYLATIPTSMGVWRVGIMGTDRMTIMIGVNMAGLREDEARYRRAFLAIVPLALLLLAGGGWVIARRALRPVALITKTADKITAHALDQRVPKIDTDGELTRLVDVINGMLDRLEKSFDQAVRFSADAAHELQTPLTILQGELDDAVQHSPVGSEEQQRYSGLLEEVQQLKVIVQKLLILARADAGSLNLRFEATDLSAMAESAAEDAGAVAPHLRIEKRIAPGVVVQADADMIGQALRNLTSNAVKYSQENGLVTFQLSVRDQRACLTISNTGVPIPEGDRERVFDRFFRADPSRNRKIPGSGLGLSLAREIARAHHGDLVMNPASGNVISFTLSMPCHSR